MSKLIVWAGSGALMVLLFGVAPAWAAPPNLDGSSPILCAVMAVTECDRWGVCEPTDAVAAGLPPFIRVDVGKKSLEATDGSGRRSEIQSSTLVPDKERLVLHGAGNGRIWSAVIGQRSGELTGAIIDHDGGFILSGHCTLP